MTNRRPVIAILQARMGSSRLPGKALLSLVEGKGALEIMLERVNAAQSVDEVAVATTTSPNDDALAELCKRLNVPCVRGSEEDVLDRYYQAAKALNAATVVRLTGDCPLQDPNVIDALVYEYLNNLSVDYMANAMTPTYPDGFDAEVFSFNALETCWKEAQKPSEREHVTPYIHAHPELFKTANYAYVRNVSALRLTLDEQADFDVIQPILQTLYPENHVFTLEDVLAYLDAQKHPQANAHIRRNEGYEKSLLKDQLNDVQLS